MTMTTAPMIQTMLFMMFPFVGVRGSNRVTEAIHYTRVRIIGVSGRTLRTVARIGLNSFMPRRRREPRWPNQTRNAAQGGFQGSSPGICLKEVSARHERVPCRNH